jgi:hypothetical protein
MRIICLGFGQERMKIKNFLSLGLTNQILTEHQALRAFITASLTTFHHCV